MPKIIVISGTVGIKYTDECGNERFAVKNASDGAFEVSPEIAKRFVGRGVAEYVGKVDEDYSSDDGDLASKPNSELREIAEKLGGDTRGCKNKAQLIELIDSLRSLSTEDFDDEGDLPELSAADPE